MIFRKEVYALLTRLEKVSHHVTRKGKTLSLGSVSDDLNYSLACVELNKGLSELELAILGVLILRCLQTENVEVDIAIVLDTCSVTVMNNRIGSPASHQNMAIALLQCLVQFKELEASKNAA